MVGYYNSIIGAALTALVLSLVANQASAVCTPPDCNGNGVCSSQTCVCNDPFTGASCDQRDRCKILNEKGSWVDLDCGQNGQCAPSSNPPTCKCDTGYQGRFCELVDLCYWDIDLTKWPTGNPCQHGGTCKSGYKTYVDGKAVDHKLVCTCKEDRKGIFCEYENPCYYAAGTTSGPHPCNSRGICKVKYKKITAKEWEPFKTCQCDVGYDPITYCEKKDPCVNPGGKGSVCKNGARCVVDRTGTDLVAKCDCSANYDGDYCERVNKCGIPAAKCHAASTHHDCNPCMNGGTCISTLTPVSPTNPIPGYMDKFYRVHTCDCSQTYYTGDHCNILKTGVVVIPSDNMGSATTFTAISGHTQVYYIVATALGDEQAISVDTGDGFKFSLSIEALLPIPEDISVLSALRSVTDVNGKHTSLYYPLWHTYSEGDYVMNVSVSNAGMVSDQKVINVKVGLPNGAACVPTTKLKDVGHTRKDATEYKRSDTFVVEANFILDCFEKEWLLEQLHPEPKAEPKFRFKWRLNKLTHLFPAPSSENDWHVEHFADTSEKFLIFKPYVLLDGIYWVECRVFVNINGKEYGNSDKGFFQMNLSPPKIILQHGTDRTVDGESEITLDASNSKDESFPERSPFLTYYWMCDSPCKEGPWTDPIVRIPGGTFLSGNNISISLRVQSPEAHTQASTSITLHITKGASISIACARNCDWFNPGDDVIFECNYNVNGKPESDIQWTWLPTNEVYPSMVENEPHMISVIIPKVTSGVVTRSLQCSATPPNHPDKIVAKADFKINTPPTGGSCTVTPTTGVYLTTKFKIECTQFIDSSLPLEYTFFVEVDGVNNKFIEKLGNRMSLGHDTNPYLEDVYLPFGDYSTGNAKDAIVNIVVHVTDDLGLSTEIKLPVVVTLPPDAHKLYADFLIEEDSVMANRFLRGDVQGGLQLQMVALYGLSDKTIINDLPNVEFDESLSAIQRFIIEAPHHSFKANEQFIYSTHFMDHVENRFDPRVLLTVTRAMHEASANLVRFAKNANEVTSAAELETLANAVADSGSRLLKAATACVKNLNQQPSVMMRCNQRNVLDFDSKDGQNADAYFEIVEDDLTTSDKQSLGTVSNLADEDTQDCSKSGRNAMRAIRGALDGAIGHLGPALSFNAVTDKISANAQIMSHVNSSASIVLQMDDTNLDTVVNITIPANTLEILEQRIDTHVAQLELQTIATIDNAFVDDTSACPSTATVHFKVQDSDAHVPVILKNLEEPIEISLPVLRSISDAELQMGKATNQKIEILPVDELDDYYELPTYQMYLPYNSKIIVRFADKSSDTMIFKIAVEKGRKPVFSDFCRKDNAIEVDPVSDTAIFYTDRIGLNEEPEEPYIDYHVSALAFDFHNIHRQEQFSIVFTRYSCLFRDEDRGFWSEQGCIVSNETTLSTTSPERSPLYLSRMKCLCNHASIISGVQFVIPHTVDHSNVLDAFTIEELENNPVVLITVCVLLAFYLIAMIICRCFDIRDANHDVALTIMADLAAKKEGVKYYLITVTTGCNFWAGTTSSMSMAFYGTGGRSKAYTLKDTSSHTVFLRGDVDSFLVSSDKDLGTLEKIRIWIDHSGIDPAWYCRKIMIRCLDPDRIWYFYLNRWLTVTSEGSTVILEVPATTKQQRTKFSVRFKENLLEQIDNLNLWFSIFRYSPASTFTRCQRLSCAFAVLTCYLLIDVWFHGTPLEDADGLFVIAEQPFHLYFWIKSLEVILLALPPGLILITLFRNIRPRYTPTLIFWNNMIPTRADLEKKNFFFPGHRKGKKVQILKESSVFEFESDVEVNPPKRSGYASATPSSAGSVFSIPSTDVPKLQKLITNRMNADEETNENHPDRLEKITAVRDAYPDTFIFQGENSIPEVEDMIEKQIQERKSRWMAGKGGAGVEEIFKKMGSKSSGNKTISEQEFDKMPNWASQLGLEMCRLSVDFNITSYLSWPWWVIFIAWGVCLLVIGICLYFTLLFGIHYGYLRSLLWLETLLTSFLMSVFVIQPLQALLFTYFFTLIGKRQKVKERLQVLMKNVGSKEEYLSSRLPYKFSLFKPIQPNDPLRGNQIFRLMIQARRKKELHGKLIRLILCVLLLIPLIAISYSGHNHYNYQVTHNVRQMFKLDALVKERAKFQSKAQLFNYFEKVVVNTLHPSTLYNGEPIPPNSPPLLSDQQTLLIGVARFRQQRVQSDECTVPLDLHDIFSRPVSRRCYKELSKSTEDRHNYNPIWEPVHSTSTIPRTPSSLTNDGWEYHEAGSRKAQSLTLRGLRGKYDAGGYILNLGRTRAQTLSVLKYMQKTNWLDHRSRAIFLEITLMNPNINKFVDVTLIIEQGPTGAFSTTFYVSPIELIPIEDLKEHDEVAWVSISIVSIVVVLLIWMLVFIQGVKNTPRGRRYNQAAFWLDLTIALLVFSSLCISLVRFISAKEFADLIENSKEDEYLSVQNAAHWSDVQRAMFSITQAIVFIKLWKLLMFTDKRFLTFALTLKLTSKYMLAFVYCMIIMLCAFAWFGFHVFGHDLWEYSTWGESMISLVDQILSVSFFRNFISINVALGPVFTFLYGYFVILIGLNFVIALLDLGVHEAREVVQQRRVWLTYSRYFKELLLRSLVFVNAAKKQELSNMLLQNKPYPSKVVHPKRWLGMKKTTADYIKRFLVESKAEKMKEMQRYCNNTFLAGTGYRMITKKAKIYEKEREKQQHIDQLRKITSVYIQDKLGHEMKPREFKQYADFNKFIVKLRIQKMESTLQKLEEKIDEFQVRRNRTRKN